MSNFGFSQLRVVNPYDPAFREARSAVGASQLLANTEEFPTVGQAVADCTLIVGTTAVGDRELQQPVRLLPAGAALMRKRLKSGNVAILFGSERVGLSNEDLSHCHWLMRIPAREEHRSVNLGQAVAICLYELARVPTGAASRIAETHPVEKLKRRLATAAEVERLAEVLLEALHISGYSKSRPAQHTEEKLRRLFRRLHIPAHDAEVLLGMLRQIVWKLRFGKDNH